MSCVLAAAGISASLPEQHQHPPPRENPSKFLGLFLFGCLSFLKPKVWGLSFSEWLSPGISGVTQAVAAVLSESRQT